MTKEEILELRKRLSTLRATANLDRNLLVLVEIIKAEIMLADHLERIDLRITLEEIHDSMPL